jgi:uncharacterized glyoxalase superfamily protein PhnB
MGSYTLLSKPALSLIVLRSSNLEAAVRFYETVGFSFVQEQHGSGAIHYSCELNGTVIEIYPGEPGEAPNRKQAGATMLGFRVDSLDTVLEILQNIGANVLTNPQTSQWGKRMVVEDPDGRAVELSEPTG